MQDKVSNRLIKVVSSLPELSNSWVKCFKTDCSRNEQCLKYTKKNVEIWKIWFRIGDLINTNHYFIVSILIDEKISLNASLTPRIPLIFLISTISTARAAISKARLASPETAATFLDKRVMASSWILSLLHLSNDLFTMVWSWSCEYGGKIQRTNPYKRGTKLSLI